MRLVQHMKAIIWLKNGSQRNSQEENAKKNQGFAKTFPSLWTRASESGQLNQIFDSVSII
jgi:hypothetical protein